MADEPASAGARVLPHRYAMVRVDEIKPHPRNPNRGDVDGIAGSIEALGFYGALIVHEPTGHILAGSHRWAAAQADGLAELPALLYDVDEDVARAIMLGDNEWSRLARWDAEQLVELLNEQSATRVGLAPTGFTADRFAELARQLQPERSGEFPEYGDDLPVEHVCPRCGYGWSGDPKGRRTASGDKGEGDVA